MIGFFWLFTMVTFFCVRNIFFFNDTATTEIYTLSLHDALPISSCGPGSWGRRCASSASSPARSWASGWNASTSCWRPRSEEHTSELQSPCNLVCRLLLEKKNGIIIHGNDINRDEASRPIKREGI